MKVLCKYDDGASVFIRTGWKHVFEHCGHQFRFWNQSRESTFDVFNQYEPDLLISTTYDLEPAILKNIAKRPNMKVAMFCSAWGDLVDFLDRKKYPIVYVTDEEKTTLEKLKRETGKPDYVFIHIPDDWKTPTIGGWEKIGIKTVGIMNAADIFMYIGGKKRKEYDSDISLVSGYWPYKATNIDRYIGPLNKFPLDIKLKIWGYGWNHLYYLGSINEENVKDVFASARVCPNISEPHSEVFPDITERVFKVISSGGVCIHDRVAGMESVFTKEELPSFSNFKEFDELSRKLIKSDFIRNKYRELQQARVFKDHTYFDRVGKMLRELDLEKEANFVLDKKMDYINSIGATVNHDKCLDE